MPNWTSNIIRAEGVEADIRRFLETVRGPTEDDLFDFDRIIPMPQLLRHTNSGSQTFEGVTHRAWYVINPDLSYGDPGYDKNDRPFTPDEAAALKDIGYDCWYDWRCQHWGTKWNACRAVVEKLAGEDGAHEIRFDTAWAAPYPIFRKLAEIFPDIAFEFTWTDEAEPGLSHTLRIHVAAQREGGE